MPIFVKNILPLMLLGLFVLGCNDQQARPGSKPSLPAPPTKEEFEQQKKKIAEAHQKFPTVLSPATREMKSNITIKNGAKNSKLQAAEDFLAKLDTLDASACPDDYCKSYNALKDAWADFFKLVVKNQGDLKIGTGPVAIPATTMKMGDFHESYDGLGFSDLEYKEAMEKVRAKTKEFSTVANRYGFFHF